MFSVDSFLDWQGRHWVFAHLNQTTATQALHVQAGLLSQKYVFIALYGVLVCLYQLDFLIETIVCTKDIKDI